MTSYDEITYSGWRLLQCVHLMRHRTYGHIAWLCKLCGHRQFLDGHRARMKP